MKTYCKAEMKFVDVTALEDAAVSTPDNQSIGSVELFAKQIPQNDYGTSEVNQFILDGSKNILTESPADIAFWNDSLSNANCEFEKNPQITILFSSMHSSSALTLYFIDEAPAEIKITWYSLYGSMLAQETYYPETCIFVCDKQIENYGKIVIEFIKTSFPKRYVKLQYILYGKYIVWGEELIKEASIQEDIDVTSATIPINEANISIVDTDNDFDAENENGAWKSIQKTQEIVLTEYKGGMPIQMGTFYMDDFSVTGNIAKFSLVDTIGLLDKYTFYEGQIYVNVKVADVIKNIFKSAGITKYLIDDDVGNILLSGYLAIQKCRQALQKVCFACGAVADDSRSNIVHIYKPDRYVKSTVGLDRKLNGNTKITLDTYVSGVSIECTQYELEEKNSEIFKGTLASGNTKITFSKPYLPTSISTTAGRIVEVKTNYLVIHMAAAGECVISGKKYNDSSFAYQKNVAVIDAGETENIKKFSGCTIYNIGLLNEIATSLLEYFRLRKKVSMKYLMDLEKVGQWANINQIGGNTSTSLIESQSIDLTGGYIATASCRGYSAVVTDLYYTGDEMYLGGDVII